MGFSHVVHSITPGLPLEDQIPERACQFDVVRAVRVLPITLTSAEVVCGDGRWMINVQPSGHAADVTNQCVDCAGGLSFGN